MRWCRFRHDDQEQIGLYRDQSVLPWSNALTQLRHKGMSSTESSSFADETPDQLLDVLPHGRCHALAQQIETQLTEHPAGWDEFALNMDAVELLLPVPRPNKLFLLAGNYALHIEEGGDVAAERAETFPYVFMKPPSTTLIAPGQPIVLPASAAEHVDWELELAVIIGKRGRYIAESDALSYVAGYTVINDISQRRFRPNPDRKQRDRDRFFDWLHGKWFDGFCPCGPCVAPANDIPNPQQLKMQLRVNSRVRQDASTSQQIFPVAAVIEFISQMVTLEPGDLISTGTPSGVGNATGDFLKAGDQVEAEIEGIGKLVSPVVAEED